MKTKDINMNDYLTFDDKVAITKIIDARIKKEFPIDDEAIWSFDCKLHFKLNR